MRKKTYFQIKFINQEGVIIAKMDETVRGNFRQLVRVRGAVIESRWQTKNFIGMTKTIPTRKCQPLGKTGEF